MPVNEERQIGRAKNAVLSFLEQRLSIPKIYIDAVWDDQRLDVLAINRDGVGDVHAVLLFPNDPGPLLIPFSTDLTKVIDPLIERFQNIAAQYKYICAVDVSLLGGDPLIGLPHSLVDKTYAANGIGKIGFLAVQFPSNQEPQVTMPFKPERFRAKVSELATQYVLKHEADWEIRA